MIATHKCLLNMIYGTEILPQQHRIFSGRKKVFNRKPKSEILMMKNRTFLKKSNSHNKNNSDG